MVGCENQQVVRAVAVQVARRHTASRLVPFERDRQTPIVPKPLRRVPVDEARLGTVEVERSALLPLACECEIAPAVMIEVARGHASGVKSRQFGPPTSG